MIKTEVKDVYIGIPGPLAQWIYSDYDAYEDLTKEDLSKRILVNISQMAVHEIREWFSVGGERIYDPHKSTIS